MSSQFVIQNRCGYFCESLSKIPVAFGFDPIDAKSIITTCYQRLEEDAGRSDFSVLLTKAVVRECIYRLSVSYFNNAGLTKKAKKACLGYSFDGSRRTDMPLPYKAVYILQKQGYPKPQIAEFLNTTVVTVSQHLALARQYISNAA